MFQMGKLALRSNLFLSPLAGYTNLPFRLVIREVGGVDLCTTDLVNARSLIERNPKALKLIETNEYLDFIIGTKIWVCLGPESNAKENHPFER